MMENATVMTAKELKAQIQFRARIVTFVKLTAKNKVKDQIRARGEKVSQYFAKELAELADQYLMTAAHREELVALAREWVQEFMARRR
jgi:hypothetical protein